MASFICQRTSSLNCRISSARSCAARVREVLERDGKPELDVAPREAHPALEVREARRIDPRVVLRPAGEALLVDLGREQLGERGAHRLRPGRAAREVDVGVDREAHAGEHAAQALDRRALAARPPAASRSQDSMPPGSSP